MEKKIVEYDKPTLREMSELEISELNGGVGFPVVVAAVAAAVVIAAGYTTVGVNAIALVNVYTLVNISTTVNTYATHC